MGYQARNDGGPFDYVCDAEADLATIVNPRGGEMALARSEGTIWHHTGTVWSEIGFTRTTHDAEDHTGIPGVGGGAGVDRFSLTMTEILFTETAGAGTYTATVPVDAGTIVLDVIPIVLNGPWDADSANFDMSDAANTYYASVSLIFSGALNTPYDPASLSDHAFTVLSLSGLMSGYAPQTGGSATQPAPGVRYAASDTITATVVTTGAGGTTGSLLVVLFGFGLPAEHIDAVKT